jgi:hypothetical protein
LTHFTTNKKVVVDKQAEKVIKSPQGSEISGDHKNDDAMDVEKPKAPGGA